MFLISLFFFPYAYNLLQDKTLRNGVTTKPYILYLPAGDQAKECLVKIIDDSLFEGPEQFKLILASAESASLGAARTGKLNSTMITIEDDGDRKLCTLNM